MRDPRHTYATEFDTGDPGIDEAIARLPSSGKDLDEVASRLAGDEVLKDEAIRLGQASPKFASLLIGMSTMTMIRDADGAAKERHGSMKRIGAVADEALGHLARTGRRKAR